MHIVDMESAERVTSNCWCVQVANFFENVGIAICEGYGLTETSPLICVNPFNTHVRRIGTVRPSHPHLLLAAISRATLVAISRATLQQLLTPLQLLISYIPTVSRLQNDHRWGS